MTSRQQKTIPRKFWNADTKTPTASTVGKMIDVLSELPRSMKLSERMMITVYNIGESDRPTHVGIEEDWS